MSIRALIVDDDGVARRILARMLGKWDEFELSEAADGASAIEDFEKYGAEIVLLDLNLPDMNGFDVLERISEMGGTICIIVTSYGELDYAIRAIRMGAFDFITKPISREVVELAINRALETSRLRKAIEIEKVLRLPSLRKLLGQSKAMRAVREQISRAAADGMASVLISGESGTGKELAARAVHEGSPRSERPFVPVNCAAIPDNLLESELFGHVRGAFTGADKPKNGLFRLAEGGSVFLDEIGEMSAALQAKLLRFLDDGLILPVGGTSWIKTDVRVIAATNRELEKEVEEGSFRRDLFYRLSVVNIKMPPLRERNEDVIFLVETFLEQQASARGLEPPKLDESAKKAIRGCSWPGNVRQLLNLAVRLVVEKPGELVTDSDIGVESSASGEGEQLLNQNYDEAKQTLIEEFTVKYFSRLLEDHEGNIAAAAREAGIQRSYLYRLIKRYDIPAGR